MPKGETRTLYLRSFPGRLADWIGELSQRTGKPRSVVVADIVLWFQIVGYAPTDQDTLRLTNAMRQMYNLDRDKDRKETPNNATTTTNPISDPRKPWDEY